MNPPAVLRFLIRSRLTTSLRCRPLIASRGLAEAATTTSSPAQNLPPPSTKVDPRISRIVDDISGLSLLEAADLVSLLKTRLNIVDIVMPAAQAPAASGAQVETDEPAEEKPKEKTIFNVKLQSFEAGAKPKIIKEVKALIPNLNLMDAKKFVESLPKVLKENLPKEDAEKLKKVFEDLGAVVALD